jgi:hypothetical protein
LNTKQKYTVNKKNVYITSNKGKKQDIKTEGNYGEQIMVQ